MNQTLGVFSLGFRDKFIRRILTLAGWDTVPGPLGRFDAVGVWGRRPVSWRGRTAATRTSKPLVTIEDAFLRSVSSDGREPPLGLIIDPVGCYLDASGPSRLDSLIQSKGRLSIEERFRAKAGMVALRNLRLSKFNDFWLDARHAPPPGYVLVVDQVPGDASISAAGASAESFRFMLNAAIDANPNRPIFVRQHPRSASSRALTHFPELPDHVVPLPDGLHPLDALDGAYEVFCVTSQIGFEAILAGHRPVVFGAGFYAGRGLTEDRVPMPKREELDAETLFHRAMIDLPVWYDPFEDALCPFERAVEVLATRRDAQDKIRPVKAVAGLRLWKRGHVSQMLQAPAVRRSKSEGVAVWGGDDGRATFRIEDGFLRSQGLGATLVPPVSIALDDLGIYYDPSKASRLEVLIAASVRLPKDALDRAARLRQRLIAKGLTKYNLQGAAPDYPVGRRIILVPGQVEDDASILCGTHDISTNAALLQAVRRANPDAFVAYKPHPDVEAGLRKGDVAAAVVAEADVVWTNVGAEDALRAADQLWTMTSLMGFEAMLREIPVTCFGQPFYAGWGLTQDLCGVTARRQVRPSLDGLVHAALIDYAIYFDPVTKMHAAVEDIITRLESGGFGAHHRPSPILSKLQGLFAGGHAFWR